MTPAHAEEEVHWEGPISLTLVYIRATLLAQDQRKKERRVCTRYCKSANTFVRSTEVNLTIAAMLPASVCLTTTSYLQCQATGGGCSFL